MLLPRDNIAQIKYYTARVKPQPHDRHAPIRQQIYLRALGTLPNLSIHYGHFPTHAVWMPDASSIRNPPDRVQVLKTEEKGSDVNLATHLVRDGFRKEYDLAVLVTNDSDRTTHSIFQTRALFVELVEQFIRVDNLASVELISPLLHERQHAVELRRLMGFLVLEKPERCAHYFTRGLVAT